MTKRKSTKRKQATPATAGPAVDQLPIERTMFAPDGAKLEFAVSPLWAVFEQQYRVLNSLGFQVPEQIVQWHSRYATMVRINGGSWTYVDIGQSGTADA